MRLLPSTPKCRSPQRCLLSTLACGALFACGDETTLPPISWSSEDFDFADEANYPLCGRTLDYQQTFVDLAQEIFGQPKSGPSGQYRWPITECTGAPLAARLGRWDRVEQLDTCALL